MIINVLSNFLNLGGVCVSIEFHCSLNTCEFYTSSFGVIIYGHYKHVIVFKNSVCV